MQPRVEPEHPVTETRNDLYELTKQRFADHDFWTTENGEAAVLRIIAKIPADISSDNAHRYITGLENLRETLLSAGADAESTQYLEELARAASGVSQLYLYEEHEETVSPEIVERYARMPLGNQGVVAIPTPLNFPQLCNLSRELQKRTKQTKFFVSPHVTLQGKITAQYTEQPVHIPVASVWGGRTNDNALETTVTFLGALPDKRKYALMKEINAPWLIYRFDDRHNHAYVLLSAVPLATGDCVVRGVMTTINDAKSVSEFAKINTKIPVLFAHSVVSRVAKFTTPEGFERHCRDHDTANPEFEQWLLTERTNGGLKKLAGPAEYLKLLWAWALHSPQGFGRPYPLHLFVVGPPGVGKSSTFNSLAEKCGETERPFSGSESTLKGLIPSFANRPPNPGYLVRRNRYALLDEFLRLFSTYDAKSTDSTKYEALGKMNDLLEHQERTSVSAVGTISTKMTARVFAAMNPPEFKRDATVQEIIRIIDQAFATRWLIYRIWDDSYHTHSAKEGARQKPALLEYDLDPNDFLALADYCHAHPATFDYDRVTKTLHEFRDLLSEDLARHYDTRHEHHAACLLDGLVKLRCVQQSSADFTANEDDYEAFRQVWGFVVRSWVPEKKVYMKIEREKRHNYLPDFASNVYKWLNERPDWVSNDELIAYWETRMQRKSLYASVAILREAELLSEVNGLMQVWRRGPEQLE